MPALKDESAAIHPAAADPAPAAGWDPGAVWRSRVQMPRLAQDLPHGGEIDGAIRTGEGWDPFQTWQYRVLRLPLPDSEG